MPMDDAFGRRGRPPDASPRRSPAPGDEAGKASDSREQHALDDQLPRHAKPAGAERHTRRQLARSHARACERQVRDVERANQQHEPGAGPEQIQDAPDAAGECFLERRDGRVHAKLGEAELRKPREHARVQRIDLRAHLFNRGPRPEPSDVKEAIPGAGVVGSLRGGEREGQPELDLVAVCARVAVVAHLEERETLRHDADDRVRLARPAESHVLADSGRIAAVEPLPQPVTQNDFSLRAELALGVGERSPQRRLHLQHAKERRGRAHPAKLLREPVDRQRVEPVGEHPLALERGERLQPIEVRRNGVGDDVIRRDGRVHVAQRDDAVRVRHRQGPQQHRVDDGERGDVGAEAYGERQDGRRAEAGVLAQQPEGGAEIAGHALHRALPHDGAQRAKRQAAWRARRLRRSDDGRFCVEYLRGERLPVGETPLQLAPGVRLGETAREECVVRVLELCGQLLDDLELALTRQFERLEASPDEREEIRHSPVRPPPARRA